MVKHSLVLLVLRVIPNAVFQEVIGKALEPAVSHLNLERPGEAEDDIGWLGAVPVLKRELRL